MFNFRTSHTRFVGAASAVVIAALSLTACGDGTGARSEGAATSTSTDSSSDVVLAGSVASMRPTGSASASRASTVSKSSSGASGSAAAGSKRTVRTHAPSKPVTCDGSNTRTVAAPLTRPVNHLLLTVTNTGGRTCYLYGYPAVQFTDAQAVPPVIEASKPQAVVTLQPGESGYASVSLSAADGSGTDGRTVKSLAVHFFGRSMSGSVGAAAHPSLPAKGVHIDDSLKVSYWEQSMDDAVDW
ncbi:DUF4232 domain-containing protein [Streptomyces sp. NPDC049541]|uniref:DUF4232 domain-containing protein n=1 Tax=Streptomyces sp. NPDC049541 TaxID=3365594 RepID=UPI0037AA49ED